MIAHCDRCRTQLRVDGRLFDVPKRDRPMCPTCGRRLRPERELPRRSVRALSGGLPSLGRRR